MAEGLAPSSDEQACILSLYIQHNWIAGLKGSRGVASGHVNGDLGFDIHKSEQLGEDVARAFCVLREGL